MSSEEVLKAIKVKAWKKDKLPFLVGISGDEGILVLTNKRLAFARETKKLKEETTPENLEEALNYSISLSDIMEVEAGRKRMIKYLTVKCRDQAYTFGGKMCFSIPMVFTLGVKDVDDLADAIRSAKTQAESS